MIRHVAGVAEIVEDIEAAVAFYRDVSGLPVQHEQGPGYADIKVGGILRFGIWARSSAAESTLGDPETLGKIPLGFTLEVDDVEAAGTAMKGKGWSIVQPPKKEPWGQVTSRSISVSGAPREVSETPWARHITTAQQVEGD